MGESTADLSGNRPTARSAPRLVPVEQLRRAIPHLTPSEVLPLFHADWLHGRCNRLTVTTSLIPLRIGVRSEGRESELRMGRRQAMVWASRRSARRALAWPCHICIRRPTGERAAVGPQTDVPRAALADRGDDPDQTARVRL